jgi:hypothetical protein
MSLIDPFDLSDSFSFIKQLLILNFSFLIPLLTPQSQITQELLLRSFFFKFSAVVSSDG